MEASENIIHQEEDGSVSFGNYSLSEKTKAYGFEASGSRYDIKTYCEITKLVRDDNFAYESVPGTSVRAFRADETSLAFSVEGTRDSQITVAGEPGVNYSIYINGTLADEETATLGGKLSFSVELETGKAADIRIVRQK